MSKEIEDQVADTLHRILNAWELMYYTGSKKGTREKVSDFMPVELHIMKLIYQHGNCMPLANIRSIVDMPNSTLSSIIGRLERNGILTKSSNPTDGRVIDLSLTSLGERINDDHTNIDNEVAHNFVSRISLDDAEAFVRIGNAASREPLITSGYSIHSKEKK